MRQWAIASCPRPRRRLLTLTQGTACRHSLPQRLLLLPLGSAPQRQRRPLSACPSTRRWVIASCRRRARRLLLILTLVTICRRSRHQRLCHPPLVLLRLPQRLRWPRVRQSMLLWGTAPHRSQLRPHRQPARCLHSQLQRRPAPACPSTLPWGTAPCQRRLRERRQPAQDLGCLRQRLRPLACLSTRQWVTANWSLRQRPRPRACLSMRPWATAR
jgi:hypothetical protein